MDLNYVYNIHPREYTYVWIRTQSRPIKQETKVVYRVLHTVENFRSDRVTNRESCAQHRDPIDIHYPRSLDPDNYTFAPFFFAIPQSRRPLNLEPEYRSLITKRHLRYRILLLTEWRRLLLRKTINDTRKMNIEQGQKVTV